MGTTDLNPRDVFSGDFLFSATSSNIPFLQNHSVSLDFTALSAFFSFFAPCKPSNIPPPEKHRFYYGLNDNANLTERQRRYGYLEREQGHWYTKDVKAGIGSRYLF
ncbi:MAG: hypothetical protein MR720_06565 [Sutterella sp.]|nr:hypothetical protein [Sutterella sp.]